MMTVQIYEICFRFNRPVCVCCCLFVYSLCVYCVCRSRLQAASVVRKDSVLALTAGRRITMATEVEEDFGGKWSIRRKRRRTGRSRGSSSP